MKTASTVIASVALALAACAPGAGVPATPSATLASTPEATATQSPAVTPPVAVARATAEEVQAIVVDPAGYEWLPATGTNTARETRAQVRGTYAGSVDPSACLRVLQGRKLALDTDKGSKGTGADAVVTLGRSAAPGPEPEAIRVRVTPDAEAATAVVDGIVKASRACSGYDYVPDTHYRESVGDVRVADATAAGAPAVRVTFSSRAEYLDGKRTSRWRGEYLAGYLYAVGNVVVWMEFDLRDSEPEQAHVDAFATELAGALAR